MRLSSALTVSVVALVLAACGGPAADPAPAEPVFDPQAEKAAIQSTIDGFLAARNAFDADAAGRFFDEAYDQANLSIGSLQIRNGQERAEAYRTAFAQPNLNKLEHEEVLSLRFITPDVAIMDVRHLFRSPDAASDFRNVATYVFVKKSSAWLISAVRLAPLAPPPAT